MEIADKNRKTLPIALVILEMQIKTTMNCHYTTIRISEMQKLQLQQVLVRMTQS